MKANWIGGNKPNCLVIDEIDGIDGGEGEVSLFLDYHLTMISYKYKPWHRTKTFTWIDVQKGAVGVLMKLLKEESKEEKKDEDSEISKKKRKGPIQLNRPIICICNNQYVPALRKLRAAVTVMDLHKPTPTRLIQRLKVRYHTLLSWHHHSSIIWCHLSYWSQQKHRCR